MANRAYLYAKKDKAFVAISEYNYDIPIAYKILVSCKTKRVRQVYSGAPLKLRCGVILRRAWSGFMPFWRN